MGGVVLVVGEKLFMDGIQEQEGFKKFSFIVSRMNNTGLKV